MYILFYFTGFFSIIIFSLYEHNKYVFKALITLLISILIIISLSKGTGGDLATYERYFYGLKISEISYGQWANDLIKILIKGIFNETTLEAMPLKRDEDYLVAMDIYRQVDHYGFKFYQIMTNLVYIAGAFSLINSTSYHNASVTKFLILLVPVSMTFITHTIEQSLSIGLVFFALSVIQKNKLHFLLLMILAGFIHWSSWMFLPLIFFQSRLLWKLLILSLTCVVILELLGIEIMLLLLDFFPNFVVSENIFSNIDDNSERLISWHHIYLSTFLVFCAMVFYVTVKNSLNFKNRTDLLLLLSTLILLLLISFIFIDVDVFVVRISAIIKIISTIYLVNAVYIINKYTRLISILFGLNLALLGVYSFY